MIPQTRPWRFARHALLGLLAAGVVAIVFGAVVMLAWNLTLPALFGWPALSFWQAVAILVLVRVLTGRFTHGPKHWHYRHDRSRQGPLSSHRHFHGGPNRRDRGGRPGMNGDAELYDTWWAEEGEAAFRAYAQRQPHCEA